MLQSVEYQTRPYLAWYRRVENFSSVMYRRELDKTKAARMLLAGVRFGIALQILLAVVFLWIAVSGSSFTFLVVGLLIFFSYPFVWAYALVVPRFLGQALIVNPRNKKLISESREIFANHKAVKIAVAGSYGKTSMKELLGVVLSEGKNVAITPANKNVSSSHAIFAQKLTGDEDILVIEYGEGEPGDVERFADITKPDIGIITGLAPAHLDHYPNLKAAGNDIFSLARAVGNSKTYVNIESAAAEEYVAPDMQTYSQEEVLGWKISAIHVGFEGTEFTMKKSKLTLNLHSGLLGRHQVGPLALVAAIAYELGLSKADIEQGISKTMPFEHRMQPRASHGAWILDDTYNGNIDGMKAGLALLKELPGKRKIYVTPGLVDQGLENENVHKELGKAIAKARPDKVVLMFNSNCETIAESMKEHHFGGELQIEQYPLDFYMNIEHFLAAGDVIMLQNDLPDQYN